MSHETYLTTHDRVATSVGPSSRGITVSWGAAAVGLAIAAAFFASGGWAIALAIGAAFSGFKAAQSSFEQNSSAPAEKDDALLSGKPTRSKSAGHEAIPQVLDDADSQWRRQVADNTRQPTHRAKGY